MKSLAKFAIVPTVDNIIKQSINDRMSLIRFVKSLRTLVILGLPGHGRKDKLVGVGFVPSADTTAIFARLKILAGLNLKETHRLQVGEYGFRMVPWTPSSRRGDGAVRQIRVISLPSFNGEEELIVDLMPNL